MIFSAALRLVESEFPASQSSPALASAFQPVTFASSLGVSPYGEGRRDGGVLGQGRRGEDDGAEPGEQRASHGVKPLLKDFRALPNAKGRAAGTPKLLELNT